MRWVNQALSTGGYADIVTDLAADMGDGITLLKLVQTLGKSNKLLDTNNRPHQQVSPSHLIHLEIAPPTKQSTGVSPSPFFCADKEGFPKHSAAPIMKARKLKNLQLCLKFLQERHIPIGRVRAEGEYQDPLLWIALYSSIIILELLAGNMESIMLICNALRTHYSSTHNNRVQRPLVYSTLEKEDMEVFAWVGKLLDKDIQSYSTYATTPYHSFVIGINFLFMFQIL